MSRIAGDLPFSLLDAAVELMGRSGRRGSVRVQGDSMTPTEPRKPSIPNGSYVAVDCRFTDPDKLSGELVAASLEDRGAVVKLLRATQTRLTLRSFRAGHADITLDRRKLTRNPIIGRAIVVTSPAGHIIVSEEDTP